MLISAKFAGSCTVCRGRIAIGDRVDWMKGRKGTIHAECVADAAPEQVAAPPRVDEISPEMQMVLDYRHEDHGDWWQPNRETEVLS
jgi:hypothetical protein